MVTTRSNKIKKEAELLKLKNKSVIQQPNIVNIPSDIPSDKLPNIGSYYLASIINNKIQYLVVYCSLVIWISLNFNEMVYSPALVILSLLTFKRLFVFYILTSIISTAMLLITKHQKYEILRKVRELEYKQGLD